MDRLATKTAPATQTSAREDSAPKQKRTHISLQAGSAIAMLAAGTTLSAAGFAVPPLGEISDSVLWLFSQCLLYAGSIFGVSSYVNSKFKEISDMRSAHRTGETETHQPETRQPEKKAAAHRPSGETSAPGNKETKPAEAAKLRPL